MKYPHFIPCGQETWSPLEIFVSDWLKLKKSSSPLKLGGTMNCYFCRNGVWEILYTISYFVPVIQLIWPP
jgi:hypothetical protein